MPYEVRSNCAACHQGDEFEIGLWPQHLGVYVCSDCKVLTNIPLATGACHCGRTPSVEEFYDYADAIPYFSGQSLGEIGPGPDCPKCGGAPLTFETTTHFNVGRLGATSDGRPPWIGKDYLEKAIFVYALLAICAELELDPGELLQYYNLDVPTSLIVHRRISLPILLDIRNHLFAAVVAGDATFTPTARMQAAIQEEMGGVLQIFEKAGIRQKRPKRKSWWQFWK